VIKSYLIESSHEDEKENQKDFTSDESEQENQSEHQDFFTRSNRARRLSLRYQNVADIIVFLQDEDKIDVLTLTFIESRKKKINDLLKKKVFEMTIIFEIFDDVRIFNSRFVDEIKHSGTSQTYGKSKLIIQTYNDHEKILVLIQAFIIQRISQRIILFIATSIHYDLFLRDITQTYTLSKTSLNRKLFIRSSSKLELLDDSILRIIKSLYDVLEIDAH
jgi:hypothetical protein